MEVLSDPGGPTWARPVPLRGFDATLGQVVPQGGEVEPGAFVDHVAASAGRHVADFPIDPVAGIAPETTIGDAIPAILDALRSTATILEPYLEQPPDDEFLHDYRVTLRRMRTLVRALERSGLAPTFGVDSQPLKVLMRSTSCSRDLDVLRDDLSVLKEQITARLRVAIQPLEARVDEDRAAAHRHMVATIRQPNRPWDSWRTKPVGTMPTGPSPAKRSSGTASPLSRPIRADSAPGTVHAKLARFTLSEPVAHLAEWAVHREERKYAKSLLSIVQRVNAGNSPDDKDLHGLRIQVKWYRYATDIFGELLFAAFRNARRELKRLKKLQDRLGSYHDLVGRRSRLERYWQPGEDIDRGGAAVAQASAAGMVFVLTDTELEKRHRQVLKLLRRYADELAEPGEDS